MNLPPEETTSSVLGGALSGPATAARHLEAGFGVWGLGFGVWGLGFRV